ncbi:MAG: acyltransferase family protein [Betaproteobacteria bacterium]|nr:acyltransferase family protein [Betaproteobacteria bacterium]
MSGKKRVSWIDAAKGSGIFFVVMAHITADPLLYRFLVSFLMPLFFFLSGITFNFSRQEQFIRRHVRSLLVPYFVFCALSFLYWFIFERHFRHFYFNATFAFLNIFIAQGGKYIFNSVMWFLPCLFIVEVCFYIICKKVYSRTGVSLIIFSCMLIGFALSGAEPFPSSFRLPVRLPWMLDTAMVSIPFLYAGAMFSGLTGRQWLGRWSYDTCGAVSFIAYALCIGLAMLFPSKMDLAEFILPNPLLFIVGACSGITAIITAAMLVPAPWLQALGRMSLVIMCIHEPIKRILLKIAEVISGISITDLRAGVFTYVAMTAITVFVCVLCIRVYTVFAQCLTEKKT